MTPAELAARHPRLYHLTSRRNIEGIRACGLLSASALLAKFGKTPDERQRLETARRAEAMLLADDAGNSAIISDNAPINITALAKCLQAGLTTQDWLRELNRRVFFWADETRLQKLIGARNNRNQDKSVLVVDTLSVAEAHGDRLELCPINSGSAIRRAAARGSGTFTPLARHSYAEWRALRGGRDSICEVTFADALPDVFSHVVALYDVTPAAR